MEKDHPRCPKKKKCHHENNLLASFFNLSLCEYMLRVCRCQKNIEEVSDTPKLESQVFVVTLC